jgi:uncharacterized protein YdeI (YjbR/CyaY-like superfamily)
MKSSNTWKKEELSDRNIVIDIQYRKTANWKVLDFITNNNQMQLLYLCAHGYEMKEAHQTKKLKN